MPEEKIQKQNVGNAGEYYVASRLSALNFVATITLGRAEKYDILALSPSGRLVKLSIKATQLQNVSSFPLSEKDETGQADDFYYIFVKLNGFEQEPDFWVIPSKIVCPLIRDAHKKWGAMLGKNDRPHGISNLRRLPLVVRGQDEKYYPKEWEKEIKQYYKNLKQLL
ncbi:MAG: hypothetical protein WCI93_02710 [bacterium]